MDFVPSEKGQTIRQPSTANLMLDSADRNANVFPLANDFRINRVNSIMNGFFTRIATTEVVLEYNTPNISAALGNTDLTIDISGTTSGVSTNTYTAQGFFTAAELIDWVARVATLASAGAAPVATWTAAALAPGNGSGPGAAITPSAPIYARFSGPIATALGIDLPNLELWGNPGPFAAVPVYPVFVDLRPFRFLDFVSAQLTYNQDLKDTSTSLFNRDVLCRWYMAYDQPPELDAYGFPILMGYTPFKLRRLFNPPKQIRWDASQPVGELGFEVYTDQNVLAPFNFNTNWLMTLQVSEV